MVDSMVRELFLDEAVKDHPWVKDIMKRLGMEHAKIVHDPSVLLNTVANTKDPVSRGKQVLFLTRNKGPFLRACPGTKSYLCCGYQILHIGTYCTMDCGYCILQAYFHPPVLQFFVNREALFEELDGFLNSETLPFHRVGTGEFTDSLIWEPWTGLSRELVSRFGTQDRAVLELKTKTCEIEQLKEVKHNRKTVLAWSVNTPSVIRSEERRTSSLEARLKAASRCEAWGYPLGFHFDPLILYDGWEQDYRKLVKRLFNAVSAKNVVWVSLGSFRFMPSLKPIIQKRFPESKIVYGEFIPGLDGKMRYFKPLRIALYRRLVEMIRDVAPEITVYFCMEDEEVWEKALGFVPEKEKGLAVMLDQAAVRHCGLAPSILKA